MAANDHSIHDEDGEAADWIEIHNPGTTVGFLDGWSLTDDASERGKWRFPEGIEMQPNAYRIVFASGKNRTNALGRLHTNFKLAASGEYLGLVDPADSVVSEFAPAYPNQFTDVSYGRDVGDSTLLIYYQQPTPGGRNVSGGTGFAPEVIFSQQSGTFPFNQPFPLTLSTFSSNAAIYYAFGTNVPGMNSNSVRYTGAIVIANSTVVRARSIEPGLLPGPISSQSYIALADDVLNFSSDLPLMILHNFGQGGVSMANQDVVVQTFEPDAERSSLRDTPAQVERGRFHIRGISSSSFAKKPFFLEVQDEFGADKESPLLGLPEESDWALYAPFEWDPPMMHNRLAYELMRDFGRYAPRTRYVELFLKDDTGPPGPVTAADYNGVYVLTEKVKRDNNRVAIDALDPEHLASPEITGGYLFAIDGNGRQDGGPPLNVSGATTLYWVSPRASEMTDVIRRPQIAYISNYVAAFSAALNGPQWTNPISGYASYVDTSSWIDYHLHQLLTMNSDALIFSTYLFKPRGGRIAFGPPWDFDRSQGTRDVALSFNPRIWTYRSFFNVNPWWPRLFADPDFWQRWIDRYQELREGALSTNSIYAHIDEFADQLWEGQLRDAARWGSWARTGYYSDGDFSYDFGSTRSYTNEVAFQKFWYANRLDFLDTNFLTRPLFSGPGGAAELGSTLTVSPALKPGTVLLYTLDGSDPRLSGGAISPLGLSNTGPVTITILSNICVAARSFNPAHSNSTGEVGPLLSSPWSGIISASFYVTIPPLRITELMYHPDPGTSTNIDEEFEYVEVMNIGAEPLNLNRFKIRGGIDFDFPAIRLDGGDAAVVVANEARFRGRYGSNVVVAGVYSNRLDNGGERLKLVGPCDEPILDFQYTDSWYPITDGLGFSLVVVDPNAPTETWNSKSQWRPSGVLNGTPGLVIPPGTAFPAVVINEVLSATEAPPSYDTIELYNASDSMVDISGWFLTDDFGNPKKYRIPPDSRIAAGGFMAFDETQFNAGNVTGEPFSLSSLGDEVFLLSADPLGNLTGYIHGFHFGAQENGISFGRQVTSTGEEHLARQIRNTLGTENSGPALGPIIVSEIMYHPRDLSRGTNVVDNSGDEFIELYNLSPEPVTLAHPDFPLNTWRLADAVKYTFPPLTVVPAQGFALVVPFDPRDSATLGRFRSRYNVPSTTVILGPYVGKLDNSTDAIELRKPDRPRPNGPPDFGFVPYPLVERVQYRDEPPWPEAADGTGASLHRKAHAAYGDDPAHWAAATPSPGRTYVGGAGPAITRQPANTTAVEYTTGSLSVEAAGTGSLIYQWRFNDRNLLGATNSVLLLTNLQSAQAGPYSVIVSDAGNSIASQTARLTVLDSVEIVEHPRSQVVAAGSNATFTVTATSTTSMTYQWRFNGTNLAGEQSRTLTLGNITNIDEGDYSVVVSDAISSRGSKPALLTVLLRPQMISPVPPLQITATSNQVITLGAETIGTLPMLYRWRRISPSGGGLILTTAVENARTHFAMFSLAGLSNGTYAYTLILTNAVQTFANVARTNAFVTIVADSDHDGLPDDFEEAHQFKRDDALDAALDADADGLSNLEEFLAGTDPRNAASYLKIDSISLSPLPLVQFGALAHHTYTLEFSEAASGKPWTKLEDFPPQSTNRMQVILDPFRTTNRYYRLVTPRQP